MTDNVLLDNEQYKISSDLKAKLEENKSVDFENSDPYTIAQKINESGYAKARVTEEGKLVVKEILND